MSEVIKYQMVYGVILQIIYILQSLSSKLLCLCGWICFRKDSVRMVL